MMPWVVGKREEVVGKREEKGNFNALLWCTEPFLKERECTDLGPPHWEGSLTYQLFWYHPNFSTT